MLSSSIPLTEEDAKNELQRLPQWVCWFVKTVRNNKGESRTTKPPMNPNIAQTQSLEERLADPVNPKTWGTYEQAHFMSRYYAGMGFVFAEADPFCGVDLDKCRNPLTGQIAEWARKIINDLNSYTEISPSGTGIHIIVRGSMKAVMQVLGRSELRHKRGHIEIYDEKRYFTFSWNHLEGTPTTIEPRQDELVSLYLFTFPEEEPTPTPTPQLTPASTPLSLSDEWIIERARLARNGRGPLFERLMGGNTSDYTYDGIVDHSRADQALLGILAYWTGRDALRMEALFKRSGLYRPERWNDPSGGGLSYGQRSIQKAIRQCHSTYNPQWAEAHRYQPLTQRDKTSVSQNKNERSKGGN